MYFILHIDTDNPQHLDDWALSLKAVRKKTNIGNLGRWGRLFLAVALCGVFAFPVSTAAHSARVVPAYAANNSSQQAQGKVKLVGKVKKVHRHTRMRVPTSENLSRYATFDSKARFHYVCRSCGKQLKKTYAWGKVLTGSLGELKRRNADKPTGGIAFTGSSLFSRWSNVAADVNAATGYPVNKVYNMAIGGTGAPRWAKDDYVNAVASLKPSVVVVSGVNSVRYGGVVDVRTDEEAASEGVNAVAAYIDKLKVKLPGVQVLVVGGVKTLNDYLHEFDERTRIVSWDRIDLYNSKLQEALAGRSGVSYVDVQRYFMAEMKTGGSSQSHSGTIANPDGLGFYCDKKRLMKATSLKSAGEIVWARQEYGDLLDPYFRRDLRHPTALSYEKVWTPYVGEVAVRMARSAAEYSLGE